MIKAYRKKPVVIEAVEVLITNLSDAARWCDGKRMEEAKASDHADVARWIVIPTLEGNMKAQMGDYIIKGVQGEFYPCKPDIFKATYEEV